MADELVILVSAGAPWLVILIAFAVSALLLVYLFHPATHRRQFSDWSGAVTSPDPQLNRIEPTSSQAMTTRRGSHLVSALSPEAQRPLLSKGSCQCH